MREWNHTLASECACRRPWHTSLMACTRSVAPSFFVIAPLLPYIYEKPGPPVEPIATRALLRSLSLSLLPSRPSSYTYIISRLILYHHHNNHHYLPPTTTLPPPNTFLLQPQPNNFFALCQALLTRQPLKLTQPSPPPSHLTCRIRLLLYNTFFSFLTLPSGTVCCFHTDQANLHSPDHSNIVLEAFIGPARTSSTSLLQYVPNSPSIPNPKWILRTRRPPRSSSSWSTPVDWHSRCRSLRRRVHSRGHPDQHPICRKGTQQGRS